MARDLAFIMSGIKIYPPNQLPAEGVSDVQFKIWKEELEVYLETEDKFEKFMAGGRYEDWQPAENFEQRIQNHKPPDTADDLNKIRKDLRQFITLVAKYVHMDYYNPILRHSTSLKWIYNKIREDYDIQQQGVHFLNILDLTWDPTGQTTPVGFYNSYRSMILGNLAKRGDEIKWKKTTLESDEKLSPSHEDLILLNVLTLLHPKLPAYVKEQYGHKMGTTMRLMDFKTEILTKAKQYIAEIENPQLSAIPNTSAVDFNYIQTRPPRPAFQPRFRPRTPRFQTQHRLPNPQSSQPPSLPPFCRICHLAGLNRSVYTSHYLGDARCQTLSQKDKQQLAERTSGQLGALTLEDEEDDVAAEYGYPAETSAQVNKNKTQTNVNAPINAKQEYNMEDSLPTNNCIFKPDVDVFRKPTACNFIQPVPAQTLTVQDNNNINVHLDLDSGATVSYAKLSTVLSHGFKIFPNNQLSNLADGKTKMSAVGEIKETFHRNNWEVQFHAIVTENLHTDFVAGNNFIKHNGIIQDITANTISVHKKYNVPETNKLLTMPTAPNNIIVQNNHINVLLPGQEMMLTVPHADKSILAVEPCFQNNSNWPPPQLCTVHNGSINITNTSDQAINIKKNGGKVQIRTTSDQQPQVNAQLLNVKRQDSPDTKRVQLENIHINDKDIDPDIVEQIRQINLSNKEVFNQDLTGGYNMAFGKHICKLNWSNNNRPQASKVHTVNYDHDTKKLLQEVCDDFTRSGVLGIPQEEDIQIQHVSPCFLVRKQRAKNKPKDMLSKDDVRLVVNFGQLNEYLKNMPTPITKPRDVFTQLGKWKYIISLDLYQGFYQNHMSQQDAPWLAIATPFGGLRHMKRSGQGLIGQSEELDELLSKIIKDETTEGKAARIADDLYIGGETLQETVDNYKSVLTKLNKANLKISPNKTKIFLKSLDVLGWVWKQGGFLSPSPHRVNTLKNTKKEDIKTVKDMRSYIGLYKTLLPASPNLTLLLDSFDKMVADRDSKEPFVWDRELEQSLVKTTEAVDNLQNLYLPHPSDQLMIVVDAAKTQPGLGHTVYAIKENKKLPVSFHSVKLQAPYDKWLPCELEALAFATAITAEYHLIKETKKPVIISPDSKPVADAVKLIKKGSFSTNPRIQSLITNVNRVPIIVQMASGKSNLNNCADFQSRHASSCTTETCSICSFVDQAKSSTLDSLAFNAIDTDPCSIAHNKTAWTKIQDQDKACAQAKSLLKSGKTPNKRSGKTPSEIRRLCTVAKVNDKNLLIVPTKANRYSTATNELTVIPSAYLPAMLWQLHNLHNHPTKSQLKSLFDRNYYSVGLTAQLDNIYNDCYFCATQKKLPDISPHSSKTEADVPGTYFHADVIRRQSQYILTARDHVSSFTAAKIIKAENNKELKSGIIDLIQPIRLHSKITVKVDNATGFKPLLDNKDHDLAKLDIQIEATDIFNKNANAVIDKACYELEQELKRIEPDGRPISNTTLIQAVYTLNQRLRRQGTISAFEMHFNRDMFTGSNLNIDYSKLRNDQLKTRAKFNDRANATIKQEENKVQTGDTVILREGTKKHAAKDVFIVTKSDNEKVAMQKIIHPHDKNEATIRSKVYATDKSRLITVKPAQVKQTCPSPPPLKSNHQQSSWNPIREEFYANEEDKCVATNHPPATTAPPPAAPHDLQPRPEQHQQHAPPQEEHPPYDRPLLYIQLDEWAQQQRFAANQHLNDIQQRQRREIEQQERRPIEPEPEKISRRDEQKQVARAKISKIYNVKIPQIDGDTVTPATSAETSPDNSNIDVQDQQSDNDDFSIEKLQELYDKCDNLLSVSLESIEPDEIWSPSSPDQPDTFFNFDDESHLEKTVRTESLNTAFCLSPLNLTADIDMTIEHDKVYQLDQLLKQINPDQPLSPHQRKKVSRWKKLFRRFLRSKKH